MLTTRELATVIWLSVMFLWALTRRDVRTAMTGVLKAFLQGRILTVVVLYSAYIAFCVWLAAKIGVWECSLLKDTIVWFVAAGFPLLLNLNEVGKDEGFLPRVARSTVAPSVFAAFFINIASFSLVVELVMIFVIALLTMMIVVAGYDNRHAIVKRLCEGLLAIIVIVLVVFTVTDVYQHWQELDVDELWRQFALTIWLPLAALPFIFLAALFAGYESAFIRMEMANHGKRPNLKARLALILGLKGDVQEAYGIGGGWARQVESASTFRAALQWARAFRRHKAEQLAEERAQQDRLRRYAGVSGTDEEGKRLDQREFAETKEALRWLATCHMGWYRRDDGGRYRSDLLERLGGFPSRGLPENHGIVMQVRSDGQAWYAWRRTVSGWVLAIGAAKEPPDQWLYVGPESPSGFPASAPGWDHLGPGQASRNS